MSPHTIDMNNQRFVDALGDGDAQAAADVYVEDAQLLAPDVERLTGRDAITGFWQAAIEMGVRGVELETLQLHQADGFAYEVGAYRLDIQPDGGDSLIEPGKYLVVHRLQPDGSWRWAVDCFNSDTPA